MHAKSYFLTLAAIAGTFLATSAHAESALISGGHHYGCIHKADYDKTSEYVSQNDPEAFTAFLGLGISTGVCVMFHANETVIVTDRGIFTSRVRRKGDLTEYWVTSEALR
jgi:hypothetical protein